MVLDQANIMLHAADEDRMSKERREERTNIRDEF